MLDPKLHSSRSVKDTYNPSNVPFEHSGMSNRSSSRLPHQGQKDMDSMDHFEDLVDAIHKHRRVHGKKEFPKEHIREHMLRHTDRLGMSRAEGRGFFGDIWKGIKKVAGDVWSGVKSVGSSLGDILAPHAKTAVNTLGTQANQALASMAQDPLGTVAQLAPLIA